MNLGPGYCVHWDRKWSGKLFNSAPLLRVIKVSGMQNCAFVRCKDFKTGDYAESTVLGMSSYKYLWVCINPFRYRMKGKLYFSLLFNFEKKKIYIIKSILIIRQAWHRLFTRGSSNISTVFLWNFDNSEIFYLQRYFTYGFFLHFFRDKLATHYSCSWMLLKWTYSFRELYIRENAPSVKSTTYLDMVMFVTYNAYFKFYPALYNLPQALVITSKVWTYFKKTLQGASDRI